MTGWSCDCGWLGHEVNYHRELEKIDNGAARYVVVASCPDCGVRDCLHEVGLCVYCDDCGVYALAEFDDMCRMHAKDNDWDFKRDQVTEVKPLLRSDS